MTNPYYTLSRAPAIQGPLRHVSQIFQEAGFAHTDLERLSGRQLCEGVVRALIALEKVVRLPTTLGQAPGFNRGHINRALAAAKDPQLQMKLEDMPVPLTPEMVDE